MVINPSLGIVCYSEEEIQNIYWSVHSVNDLLDKEAPESTQSDQKEVEEALSKLCDTLKNTGKRVSLPELEKMELTLFAVEGTFMKKICTEDRMLLRELCSELNNIRDQLGLKRGEKV